MVALKAGVIAGMIAAGTFGIAKFEQRGLWPLHKSDAVSDSDQQARAQAFAALSPLTLSMVADKEVDSAIDGMGLPAPQKQALAAAVQQPMAVLPAMGPAAATSLAPAASAVSAPQTQPVRGTVAKRVRLAWVSLWDTDAEDGDIVRIESQGYARTVRLTKAPVTIAIPVPSDGVIKVVGVSDGDGGGITVGLGSGAAQAVFPIMSDGQVLGLRVAVR